MLGLLNGSLKLKNKEPALPDAVVEVYGKTEGAITGANWVIVADTGCCKSNIQALHLEVAGEVHGDVDVGELVIKRNGRLYGQAKYQKLVLAEGAVFYSNSSEKFEDISSPVKMQSPGLRLVSKDSKDEVRRIPISKETSSKPLPERDFPEAKRNLVAEGSNEACQKKQLVENSQEPCFVTSF